MLSRKCLHLTAPLTLAGGLLLWASAARAQEPQGQAGSVADAARKAREEKKAAPKSKVITDDDLNKMPKTGADTVNVASPSSPTAPTTPAGAAETPDQAPPPPSDSKDATPAKKHAENPEIAKLKEQIALAKKELDLDQRELALDQDTYLSNPNHGDDAAGKAKLAREQQQINDAQQRLDALKTRLAALLELESRKKSASDEAAPSQPQS